MNAPLPPPTKPTLRGLLDIIACMCLVILTRRVTRTFCCAELNRASFANLLPARTSDENCHRMPSWVKSMRQRGCGNFNAETQRTRVGFSRLDGIPQVDEG